MLVRAAKTLHSVAHSSVPLPLPLLLPSAPAMSSASSSSSGPSPVLSKAAIMKARAERQKIMEEKAALEARQAALDDQIGLRSTFDKSLEHHLDIAHSGLNPDVAGGVFIDGVIDPQYIPTADDFDDFNFWESGIEEPSEEFKDLDAKASKKLAKKWMDAYHSLEVVFMKRALALFELKIVYAKKRALLKEAMAEDLDIPMEALALAPRVIAPVARVLTTKNCGCTTKCSQTRCGCRTNGVGCISSCTCACEDCLNPYSYPDGAAGRAKLAAAETKANARDRKKAQQKLDASQAALARRAENGME